ncbi:MAG: DNA polymerase III subunit gamma and tau [Mycobacteriales bacterium]
MALYRKYRPQTFAEVIGQEHVTDPLRQALRSGRIHHAYLFSGPRGCGKTSSARILALSLNCEDGPTPDPCGKCDQCVAIAAGNSLDVVELDAASHGGVDDARDLRERAFFSPVSARFKVYIVDEAHMVSREGFNALLKLVEEPPEFLKFVFATTEPDKVLPTIRSRTHHYPFRLAGPRVLNAHLAGVCAREGIEVDPRALTLVTRAGAGSFRDALSVLDQLIAGAGPEGVTYERALALLGVTDLALLDEAVDALAARDGGAVFHTVARVVDAGHDPRRFAADLLERLRDLIILRAVPDAIERNLIDVDADQLSRMTQQAGSFGEAELSRAADLLNDGLTEMRGTTSPRLMLELTCARVLLPGAARDEAATLARVDRLERRMSISGAPEAGQAEAPVRRTATAPAAAPRTPATSEMTSDRESPRSDGPENGGNRSIGSSPAASMAPVQASAQAAAAAPAAPAAAAPAAPAAAAWPTVASTGADEKSAQPVVAAAQPPSVPVVAAAGGPVDAAAVRRVWSDVLDSVRQRKRTPHALLLNAQVTAVSDKAVTVSFNSAALARQFDQGVNCDVLREALREVLGVEWTVTTAVQGAEPELPSGPSGFAAGDAPTDEPAAEDVGADGEPQHASPRVSGEDAAMALLKSGLGAHVIGEVEQS